LLGKLPDLCLGLSWDFTRCWTRLYGTVTLEIIKHMDLGAIMIWVFTNPNESLSLRAAVQFGEPFRQPVGRNSAVTADRL